MKLLHYLDKYDRPLVLAMGFFDCVHKGHVEIISRAANLARKLGAECAVFTFSNDPCAYLGKKPQLYSFNERVTVFSDLGVDVTVFAEFKGAFVRLSPEEFLISLTSGLNIAGIVAGEDYTFGVKGRGNSAFLRSYFANTQTKVEIMPFIMSKEGKISSTYIKNAIERGDIEFANECLTEPYFMLGTVVHAHKRGSTFGFPTANMMPAQDKLRLKDGVYITSLTVDDKTYFGGTNVGTKPTFDDGAYSVETYILDFDGDLYGKRVKLAFRKRIRDIVKFDSAEGLAAQLTEDTAKIRSYFADQNTEKTQ